MSQVDDEDVSYEPRFDIDPDEDTSANWMEADERSQPMVVPQNWLLRIVH